MCVTGAGTPLPAGTMRPLSRTLFSVGSGQVLPTPFVLCFPGGSLVTNSDSVFSYLTVDIGKECVRMKKKKENIHVSKGNFTQQKQTNRI